MLLTTKSTTDSDINAKKIYDAFIGVTINILLNSYALENVVVGFINPADEIPFDKYVYDLNLNILNPSSFRKHIEGFFIDKNEKIINVEKDRLLFDFYANNVQYIFNKTIDSKYDILKGSQYHCNDNTNDYFLAVFQAFKEISYTDIEYEFLDIIPNVLLNSEQAEDNEKIKKFLSAIKLRDLRKGKCVNRYLKDIKCIPSPIKNLIKISHNKYILTKDSNSLDYKVALFSEFNFLNKEHKMIFDMKIQKWFESKIQPASP